MDTRCRSRLDRRESLGGDKYLQDDSSKGPSGKFDTVYNLIECFFLDYTNKLRLGILC